MSYETGRRQSTPSTSKSRRRRWVFRSLALLLGLTSSLIALEVAVRLYSPFAMRIRGSRINLPVNTTTVIFNNDIKKLDVEVTQTRNAIGFRGSDPPADLADRVSIVAVGGSTTECFYLSDEKTWPAQLEHRLAPQFTNIWINNAGLDGHSTYGHLHLLNQYLATLRPKVVLYLIGLNDVGTDRPLIFDENLQRIAGTEGSIAKRSYLFFVENTATCALFDNFRRQRQASQAGVTHGDVNHHELRVAAQQSVIVTSEDRAALLQEHRSQYLSAYEQRVRMLIRATRTQQIQPVLITQPALYGPTTDPVTGVNLGEIRVGEFNGEVRWEIVELYNDVTRLVSSEEDVWLIDLASEFPKDSSLYYDFHHFTNDGASRVADIVAAGLKPFLSQHFDMP